MLDRATEAVTTWPPKSNDREEQASRADTTDSNTARAAAPG